jgi:formylglycine-generating enzyme required for sulfatase activity/predicted phosphodiesterase
MNGLTWLHLSDWHQKGRDFDRTVVRDALVRDVRERAKIDPALADVDFVIFSGDVAWQGKAEEFQSARECLFEPVLKELGLSSNKLFIVPGNHDLSREVVGEMLPEALKKPLETGEQVQKWLTDEKKRSRAMEPFEDFASFVTGYTGQKPPAYANTWSGFIGNQTVGILCLNSAWMCGRNQDPKGEVNEYGFLTLGEAQLHDALAAIQGADVRLAVLHHPFAWLAEFDRNRIEERLKRECHFILHGHEHQPKFNLGHELSGECAVIPAGACYERRTATDPRYTNAYNFVHLDFETGQGVIFLRRWSDRRNEWLEDTDSHPAGKFSFELPKELAQPKPGTTKPIPQPSLTASPAPLSPAIQAYLHRLEELTAKLQLIGLGQGVQIELPIQEAYIPLNVVVARGLKNETQFHFDEKALRQREHVEENVLLCDIFKWATRFDSRGVLLLGDPGAGKTTGARQFCWRVLKEVDLPKSLGLPAGTLPVFLRLRQVTPHHLAQGLQGFINDSVAATTLPPDLADPGPDLLARKGVLWVFDGLDEVVNENARVHVCGWIKQALAERPDDLFLVTSRYQGYQGKVDLGPGFCQFHVKPLNPEQVAEFVDHWYRSVFQKLHGPGADIAEKATQEIASLMKLLQQPEYQIGRLRELPANPLMLTILCVVHHQDRNLPRRRADLYAKCVRVLVEHWRREMLEDQGVAGFVPEAAEGVLASVAWWLHEQDNRTSQTVEELGAHATGALADLAPGAGLGRDGAEFIRRMRDESGILTWWSAGQCGFLHLTFQEYLAGLHAAREGRAEELVWQIGRSWWREVILVAVAIGSRDFAEKFFNALLKTDAVAKEGAFVDQCLDEACYALLEPFIEALRKKGVKLERQVDILRRLRHFKHDKLTAVCRELAQTKHPELSALAREILQRAGVELPRPAIAVGGTPLEQRVDSSTGIAFIAIPAGEFDMGASDITNDEKPVHHVRISKPFLLGKYQVTNQEYQRFLEANPKVKPPGYWSNSQFNDPQQPVVGVSWEDAQVFCRWAGGRLPTETEWEYACRAGSKGKYCFGDEEAKLGEYAWYSKNSGGKTHPVGQKQPNAWGLYDVHGNVWEWCQDWFASDYYQRSPKVDPTGPEQGTARVLRGGSWDRDTPRDLSCSYRNRDLPVTRFSNIGFRCVMVGMSSARG